MSTTLWALWVLAFGILEWQGLQDPHDSRYTLTNRVRAIMNASPALRIIARGGIAVGLAWLTYHFLGVDPAVNPGAFMLWRA